MSTEIDPAKLLEQGRLHLVQGRIRDAEQTARFLDNQYPNNPSVLAFIAEIAMRVRDTETAETAMRRVIELAPEDPTFPLMYAGALAANSKHSQAIDVLARAATMRPDDAAHLQAVGAYFSKLGEQHRAHDLFRAALELQPDNAQLCQNLAAIHRYLGNLGEAEAYAERAVRLDPMTPDAVFIRSDVRRVTAANNHIEDINQLIEQDKVSGAVRMQCYFALSKEYEDIGAHDEAFAALTEACALRRKSFSYDVETDLKRMRDIPKYYDAAFFQTSRNGHIGDKTPIFILGMPRTGSTLVERFLVAHSKITTAGERKDFSVHLAQQTQKILNEKGWSRVEMVRASIDMDFEKLGRDYMTSTAGFSGNTPFFIDKLPFNFLYVGLILTALPNAKIVHTVRHPMDTCYAVFKMLFDRAYPFSYDLEELGRYFVAYYRLLAHWKALFGDRIIEVRYEEVVLDTEPTIRRLIHDLGLEWEDACRSNVGGDEESTTASASQARKPVYATSVGMWCNYARQLQPLKGALEDAGIKIGEQVTG